MKKLLIRLWVESEAQDLTEYALLLALVALSAIAAMQHLGGAINNMFQGATQVMQNVPPAQ